MHLSFSRATLLLSSLSFVVTASGCGKDDCEKLYEQEVKCDPDSSNRVSKSDFVTVCKAAKTTSNGKEKIASGMACVGKTCAEAETCKIAQRGKKRAKAVTKAIAAGKYGEAFSDCSISTDYYAAPEFKAACVTAFAAVDKLTGEELESAQSRCKYDDVIKAVSPEFAAACRTFGAAELKTAWEKATASRDEGTDDYSACSDLDSAAKGTPDEEAKVTTMCDELAVSKRAKEALEAARKNVAAKTADMPFECGKAKDDLAKINSDWSKSKLTEILAACYGELGAVIIEAKRGDSKYGCPYEITKVVKVATEFNLVEKFPALANVPDNCKAATTSEK